jgi:hypothetical protein
MANKRQQQATRRAYVRSNITSTAWYYGQRPLICAAVAQSGDAAGRASLVACPPFQCLSRS